MKIKEVTNESSPSVRENVPSGERVSGKESKVC